jgi:gluconolactonase
VCEQANKRVVRTVAGGNPPYVPVASTYMGAQFNSTNDLVVRGDGNIYFTDPCYGCAATQNDEAVYRVDPQMNVTRLAHNFVRPNGIALSPDGSTLYVVDNGAGTLHSAPVATDGSVGTFANIANVPGGDGMAVDDAGNLYVTDNAGVDVFDKTGQTKIGTITVAVKPANCTFGGADRKTLYITANGGNGNPATGLYQMKLNVPGLP